MEQIRDLSKDDLALLIRDGLPNARIEDAHIWKGTISPAQLFQILGFVKVGRCIEDGIGLLSEEGDYTHLRQAVSYCIPYNGCESDISFEVVDTQRKGPSPHGYLGHIFTHDKAGNEVRQLTLENITINRI